MGNEENIQLDMGKKRKSNTGEVPVDRGYKSKAYSKTNNSGNPARIRSNGRNDDTAIVPDDTDKETIDYFAKQYRNGSDAAFTTATTLLEDTFKEIEKILNEFHLVRDSRMRRCFIAGTRINDSTRTLISIEEVDSFLSDIDRDELRNTILIFTMLLMRKFHSGKKTNFRKYIRWRLMTMLGRWARGRILKNRVLKSKRQKSYPPYEYPETIPVINCKIYLDMLCADKTIKLGNNGNTQELIGLSYNDIRKIRNAVNN